MKIIKPISVIAALAIGAAIGGFVLVRVQRGYARSLVTDIEKLQAGSTNAADALAFVKTHRLQPQASGAAPGGAAVYERVLDNSLLARLRLAPWTRLGVLIRIENNRLDYVDVDYYVSCIGDMTSGVRITEVPTSPGILPYQTWVSPAAGKPPNINVRVTPSSSAQQRASAFALNVDCLTRIGGCSGASDLSSALGMPGLDCSTLRNKPTR